MPERSPESYGRGEGRRAQRASRVLVVDDEESVRITTAAILEQEGYEVATAESGREALASAARSHYDLVLTDLRMDDMDGLALLHELQARHPNVVTVVLTGYASIESSIDALRQGVYDYLVKPCMVEDLKRTVRRALEHREQRMQIRNSRRPSWRFGTACCSSRSSGLWMTSARRNSRRPCLKPSAPRGRASCSWTSRAARS